MELMTRNMDFEAKLLDDLDDKRHELAARDISTAACNAAVGTGIHTEKAQLLNDQPTSINKLRDASDVLRQLKNRAPGLFIEGTVESEEGVEPPALTDGSAGHARPGQDYDWRHEPLGRPPSDQVSGWNRVRAIGIDPTGAMLPDAQIEKQGHANLDTAPLHA